MILKPSELIPDNGAYSAEEEIQITWKNNGDSLKAYEITVEDNSTGIQVYTSGKVTAYSGKHTIPINTFTNGKTYRYRIKVYNSLDEYATSTYKVFYCYSKPIVAIPNDGYVRNQIINIQAEYSQAENLLLNAYEFTLYDEYGNILEESGYLHDGLLTYEFQYKLINGTTYQVECMCITTNSIYGSSGKVSLIAEYEAPTVYFKMQATVPDRENYIELAWSTVRIIGETENPPVYLNNNTMLDLLDNKVTYGDGFILPETFTLRMWIKNIQENINFVELSGNNGNMIMKFYNNKIHVFRKINGLTTHIASEDLITLLDSTVYVCLQQIDKYMNIFSEVI